MGPTTTPTPQDAKRLSDYETTLADYYDSLWTNPQSSLRRAQRDNGWHFDYHDTTPAPPHHRMDAYIDRRLNLAPKSLVLDAGCGIGTTTLYLASQHPTCSFIGLTLAPNEVHIARHHQTTANQENVRFLQGSFLKTTFPDASFHAAYALESANHAEDKRAFANEMHRLLKPHGTLLILDLLPTKRIPRQAPAPSLLQRNTTTLTQLLTHLRDAGFTIHTVDNLFKNRTVSRLQVLRFGLLFADQQKASAPNTRSTRLQRSMTKAILLPRAFLQLLYNYNARYGYYVITATKPS